MSKKPRKDLLKEIAQELDVFDDMLTALVELLEEKKVLTQEDWENRIKSKIEKRSKTTSYRELQFEDA